MFFIAALVAFALLVNIPPAWVAGAVDDNNVVVVRLYLLLGGDPSGVDENGQSLLYIATGPEGGNQVLQLLLKHKADLNRGHKDYTPLMNAASWDRPDMVKALLKAGANPLIENRAGETVLDVAGPKIKQDKAFMEKLRTAVHSYKPQQ